MKSLLREDRKAKTKAYFFKKTEVVFNRKIINFLEKYYKKNKKDIRVCIHRDPSEKQHDMVLLQKRKDFYKPWFENRKMGTFPHKHLKKGETYHMIFGKMGCVLFNNNGKVKKMCVLKKGDIFRVPKNTYHTMMPITNYVVYHESKIGPFLKKADSIFPKWLKKYNKFQYLKKFRKKNH